MHSECIRRDAFVCIRVHSWAVVFCTCCITMNSHCILHMLHSALVAFCTCCILHLLHSATCCILVHSRPTTFRDCCILVAFHCIPRWCILDTQHSQKRIRDLLHYNAFEYILNRLHSIRATDTCIRMHCRMRYILTTCCIRTLSHNYCIRMQTHALCMHYEVRFVRITIMHMHVCECKRMRTKCTR